MPRYIDVHEVRGKGKPESWNVSLSRETSEKIREILKEFRQEALRRNANLPKKSHVVEYLILKGIETHQRAKE